MTATQSSPSLRVHRNVDQMILEEVAKHEHLDTTLLRQTMMESLSVSVTHLMRAAACLRCLENRGDPCDDLEIPFWLRRVAWGQLLPETVQHCAGKPSVLRTMERLPLPYQRQVIDKPLSIVVRNDQGEIDEIRKPILDLSNRELKQVFAEDGSIRNIDQQTAFLREQERAGRGKSRRVTPKASVDRKRGEVVLKAGDVELRLSRKELHHWLSELEP